VGDAVIAVDAVVVIVVGAYCCCGL